MRSTVDLCCAQGSQIAWTSRGIAFATLFSLDLASQRQYATDSGDSHKSLCENSDSNVEARNMWTAVGGGHGHAVPLRSRHRDFTQTHEGRGFRW
jgi:hypothetical protein